MNAIPLATARRVARCLKLGLLTLTSTKSRSVPDPGLTFETPPQSAWDWSRTVQGVHTGCNPSSDPKGYDLIGRSNRIRWSRRRGGRKMGRPTYHDRVWGLSSDHFFAPAVYWI